MNAADEVEHEPTGVSSALHKMVRFVEVKKTITLGVDHFDKIDDVKDRISKVQSVASNMQNVFFTEECFQNGQALDYERKDGSSSVHMILNLGDKIQINVKALWSGKTFKITVDSWDEMSDIKKRIVENEDGLQADELTLIYGGKQLKDSATVLDCGLDNDSILTAVVIGEDKFGISVEIPGQGLKPIEVLEVRFSSTVGNLKNIIYGMTGLEIGQQNLIFNKVLLEDKGILADYNIRKGSVVKLASATPGFLKPLIICCFTALSLGKFGFTSSSA